jgi:hypothetical protein
VEIPSGLIDPIAITPPRPARSVRRTSNIDIAPDKRGGLTLTGAARDLRTEPHAEPRTRRRGGQVTEQLTGTTIASAKIHAWVGADRRLAELDTTPPDARTASLLGRIVGPGFRATVVETLPDQRDEATPLYLLLDDLPVAVLISGYAMLYSGELSEHPPDAALAKEDICSGWRSSGTMMVALRGVGSMPVPVGPVSNRLEPADDPHAWHDIGPLAPLTMRRRRLVEVTTGDPLTVYAMFRDTHVDTNGAETVLHEYSLNATVDPATLEFIACQARPQVLPWVECPDAAASATRLAGHHVADVRALVGKGFRGTTTCTHLNDLLRSLSDVGALASHLGR